MAHPTILGTQFPFYFSWKSFRLSKSGKSVWCEAPGKFGTLRICDHRLPVVSAVKKARSSYSEIPDVIDSSYFWEEELLSLCDALRATARLESQGGFIHLYDADPLAEPTAWLNHIYFGPNTRDYEVNVVFDRAMLSWFSQNWGERDFRHVDWVFITTQHNAVGVYREFYPSIPGVTRHTMTRWVHYGATTKTSYSMPRWASKYCGW